MNKIHGASCQQLAHMQRVVKKLRKQRRMKILKSPEIASYGRRAEYNCREAANQSNSPSLPYTAIYSYTGIAIAITNTQLAESGRSPRRVRPPGGVPPRLGYRPKSNSRAAGIADTSAVSLFPQSC